ncbi:arylsulfatase I [Osmerus eperlanus]|uniref:arylsulfatase I n=1 Tax=Osmerus eperlanus TaxID=29151 RepID=UPI002E132F4C
MQAASTLCLFSLLSIGYPSLDPFQPNLLDRDENTQDDDDAFEPRRPPHIIFILTDDQGYNDVGYHNPDIHTPTLDRLAAEGVKLENYYVQPICTPSRSQLLTGRYQIHTGLQHSIIRPRQPSCLPRELLTLPQRLLDRGYATHMVGKWHLGFYRRSCLPTQKGFQSFFGSLTGSVDYYSYGSCDGPGLCGYDLHEDEHVSRGYAGRYSTHLFTQRARAILSSHNASLQPLFLFLSLQAVHTPLHPPKSYIYPYRRMGNIARRKYAAMVTTVDESVRKVTYALRKYGFYRNSVLIFSTDNGAQPFTGGSNWPLRGRKGTYWEGGVRAVGFVHSPLLRHRRRTSRALLHISDWYPTLVGLAGGNVTEAEGLDGYDVWPTISEGKESPRLEILHNINPLHRRAGQGTGRRPAGNTSRKSPGLAKASKKSSRRAAGLRKASGKKAPSTTPSTSWGTSRKGSSRASRKVHKQDKAFSGKDSRKVPGPTKAYMEKGSSSRQGPRRGSRTQVPSPGPGGPVQEGLAVFDTSVQAAIRVGDWKLLTGDPGHGDWVPPQVLATLSGTWWNLERNIEGIDKSVWLFNITADPYERHDLANQRPDVVRQLLSRLAFYNRTAVPVRFPDDDPRANPDLHGGAWVPWVGEEEEEGGGKVSKKGRNKTKRKKCKLCKLKSFFNKLNTRMMSNRIDR